MSHLRVLTYNTQLRSWMMEVGLPPTLPPVYTAPERAKVIAERIINHHERYDIVCLNEVFDEDAREILFDALRTKYPYQANKADLLYIRLALPGFLNNINEEVFNLVFEPILNAYSLLAGKFEDSGLFLASKWPFDTISINPAMAALLGPIAGELGAGLPVVSFAPFKDCAGGDCRAAKGILHARIRRSATELYDIFMSHTQADDKQLDENAGDRTSQLRTAWHFIKQRVGGLPFANPVLFLGDFNILGGATENDQAPQQWQDLFNTPGEPFTDAMSDLWGTVQCRGGKTGLTDPGFTANVSYEPFYQRLDYIIAELGPRLVCQHIHIDYELAQPPANKELSYISDHLPLVVDIAYKHDNASPSIAFIVTKSDFQDVNDVLLGPGEARWYRFDKPGTYEFRIFAIDPSVYYEVYTGDDLSRPHKPYRNERDPEFGDRFVLMSPILIKVANKNRTTEFMFRFSSHRHEGRTVEDAINLIIDKPMKEGFPSQQLNGDDFSIPWNDTDTKWFIADAPRISVGSDIKMSLELALPEGGPPLSITIATWDGMIPPQPVIGPNAVSQFLEWMAKPDQRFLIGVQRHDPTFPACQFSITARTNVTFLLGGDRGQPRLTCSKETSGWGADDIALEFSSTEGWRMSIPNDEIGDFEQDAVRDLRQWVVKSVPYMSGLKVDVIEEDDIDSNDVGSETIPSYEKCQQWDKWTPAQIHSDGTVCGTVRIMVDDGIYLFHCAISKWDETL